MDYSENMRLRFIFSTLILLLYCSIGFAASTNYVDLGLSVKWATCNLGASSPSDMGERYAWGETKTKSDFTWANYLYANGTSSSVVNIGSDIAGTDYDAAKAQLGSNWRMPSKAECQELVSKCTFKTVTIDGSKCLEVTGPNGNSIVLPLAGYMSDGTVTGNGSKAYYLSGNIYVSSIRAYALYPYSGGASVSYCQRRTGALIRPVYIGEDESSDPSGQESGENTDPSGQESGENTDPSGQETGENTDPSGQESDKTNSNYIDLGLSVKWATCNLGASNPSDMGERYAWGETKTKSDFTWANYLYANGTSSSVVNIGSDIAGTDYDAAKAQLGSNWRMPSKAECQELVSKCTFKTVTIDGSKCLEVTGPNGNSIVLPLAGYMSDGTVTGNGSKAYYLSGNIYVSSIRAYALYPYSGGASVSYCQRRTGALIRPVYIGEEEEPTPTEPTEEDPMFEAIDLGLSVSWASCNFGASEESETGDLFAWGEVSPKSDYTWANYVYANGTSSSVVYIGNNISDTPYDPVASSSENNANWRMPTKAECQELVSKCTFKAITVDGVKGVQATGPNGNTIFFPYTGYKSDGKITGEGTQAYYMTGDIYKTSIRAYGLFVTSGKASISYFQRRTGVPIRAVCPKDDTTPTDPVDPVEPVDPVDPVDPVEPVDPIIPGYGINPVIVDPTFNNQSFFDTDGIENMESAPETDSSIYTLSGAKVDDGMLKPGIYIRNGKKFIVK